MNFVWTTDPHLNHASTEVGDQWIESIKSLAQSSDATMRRDWALLITGDISEGDDVVFQLHRMAMAVAMPIYFVLGNHDFYRSSIAATRQRIVMASREDGHLNYLTDQMPIEVAEGCFLVGEDGWGDATVGDFEGSTIRLNDFDQIEDFQRLPREHRKSQLQQLGLESSERLAAKLESIPETAQDILLLTHVPPFREACWYEGQTTDDYWAPFFVCGQVGQTLRCFAQSRPQTRVRVLCGHTHHAGVARISDNLMVHTGATRYGHPDVEGVCSLGADGVTITPVGSRD